MAATTGRLLMNPLQFKDKYPYHTPIFAVNLRRSHPCSASNGKSRSLTIKDGSIEGVPRLRAAYQEGVPGADSESAAEKTDPNCEACFEAVEDRLVDRAVPKIENSTAGDIDWSCYNLVCRILRSCDVEDQKLARLLDHLQINEVDDATKTEEL